MSNTFVKSFTHLKDRPKSERALPMLQRIASLVKPIMRKHGWVLPVLSEFFPESPNLVGLNVNGGEKILLRLRPASAPDTFYDEEDVVLVMLHELTHNVHGPHDEKFYKFLSSLEDEYEALKRSGYAGEGFHSKGNRLGVNISHDLPPHIARAKALEAAEKRKKVAGVLSGGGRLGGQVGRNMSPRELAAQAAERRARDEKACGSGATAKREADKAAKDSIEDVVDLTGDSDDEIVILDHPSAAAGHSKLAVPQAKNGTHPLAPASSAPRTQTLKNSGGSNLFGTTSSSSSNPSDTRLKSARVASTDGWSCPTCTLVNTTLALQCDACLSNRPPDPLAGWMCMSCGEVGMPHEFWTCRFCGTMKTESVLG